MISKNIGLGTATIGRPQYINIRTESNTNKNLEVFKANGLSILEAAYQKGIRYFDTAPGYGMAEDLLSEWLQTKNHNDLEIATKWGYKYVANFNPNAKIHEIKEHSLDLLNTQWENSISKLSNITTLQIHSATFETGVLEDMNILNRLNEIKNQYDIKIGLSTTGPNQVDVLNYALDINIDGEPLFETFQVTYNILDQSLVTIFKKFKGKRLIIKEALANGRLLSNANYAHYKALYSVLDNLAKKHQTSTDAIALRFCVDSINPFMVLSGASKRQHLLQNLEANNFELNEEELSILYSFKISADAYWSERKKLAWN